MERQDHLNEVAREGARVQKLNTLRDKLVARRDAAAWSLHTHGDASGPWPNPRVRAIFGASSHDAWTKSRKRMVRDYPDGAPVVPDAAGRLHDAATRLSAVDAAYVDALKARRAAALKAKLADDTITYSDLARAAGIERQAMWSELSK